MNTRLISRENWLRLDRLVTGECSEEDIRALEASLGGNPAAQKAMLEYCQLHIDLLIDVHAETASKPLLDHVAHDQIAHDQIVQSAAPSNSPALPSSVAEMHSSAAPDSSHPLRTIGFAITGWCVAVFAGLVAQFLLLNSPPGNASNNSASKNSADQNVGAIAGNKPVPLAGQSLRLDSGTAKLVLPGIGYVVLEGPVDFDLISEKRARLKAGRIKMRVTEETGRGFVVETPDGEITDLGTEFGVEVVDGRETGLVVFEGSVDLRVAESRPSEAARTERLFSGEGALFNRGGPLTRISSIFTGNVATFVRNGENSLEQPAPPAANPPVPLIVKVGDNLRSADTKKFYEIVPGGLREDAKAYVDTVYEWNGLTAEGIPSYLIGADYVKMLGRDCIKTKFRMRVTLARPAKLYVFLDARSTPPDWLEKDFRNTGDRIGLDATKSARFPERILSTGPGQSIDNEFVIWEREIREPSEVRLGTNLSGFPRPAMYGVAAVPLDGNSNGILAPATAASGE